MAVTPAVDGAAVPKHRACDECRARKLACSKEPDGCARCKREGIACYYSPQKPMGRPRKRRNTDLEGHTPSSSSSSSAQKRSPRARKTSSAPRSSASPRPPTAPTSAFNPFHTLSLPSTSTFIDPTLAFVDQSQSPSMPMLDMEPDFYQQSCDNLNLDIGYPGQLPIETSQPLNFGLSTIAPTGNFDMADSFFLDSCPSTLDETVPSLSHGSHLGSPEACASPLSDPAYQLDARPHAVGSPRQPAPNVSCGCLSSLYFALESLANLPTDIPSAMRVARGASKIVHDVVGCSICSGNSLGVGEPLPIQSFQNFTFLGSLIPSACNAYATIVEMVHQQSNRAKQENRTLPFSYWQLGGQWPSSLQADPASCLNLAAYDNKDLHPDVWREVMCSIMRIDVFGSDGTPHTLPNGALSPSAGLKGVVAYLDTRSDDRHMKMDELNAAGGMPKHNLLMCPATYHPQPKKDRHCIRTLHLARVALDSIVIG